MWLWDAKSPYMELDWACFMQITLPVAAHVEDSKVTNVRTSIRTNSCVYACVVN